LTGCATERREPAPELDRTAPNRQWFAVVVHTPGAEKLSLRAAEKPTAAKQNRSGGEQTCVAAKRSSTAAKQNLTAPNKNRSAADRSFTAPDKNRFAADQSYTAPDKNRSAADQSYTAPNKNRSAANQSFTAPDMSLARGMPPPGWGIWPELGTRV